MPTDDRIAEIRAALAAMTFDRFGHEDQWSVDAHGKGWALMLGGGHGMHGLNMVHLTEPSYQWPVVGRYLLAAMNAAPALLSALDDRDREIERLREDGQRLLEAAEKVAAAVGDEIDLNDAALDLEDVLCEVRCGPLEEGDGPTLNEAKLDAAFRAGAEAMREVAIAAFESVARFEAARLVRALPVPEAKR